MWEGGSIGEFCCQVGVFPGHWLGEVDSPRNKMVPTVVGRRILAAHGVGCQGNKMYECCGQRHRVTKLRLLIALIAIFPQPRSQGSLSSFLKKALMLLFTVHLSARFLQIPEK